MLVCKKCAIKTFVTLLLLTNNSIADNITTAMQHVLLSKKGFNTLKIDFSKELGNFNPDISFSGGLGDGCVGNTEFWDNLKEKITVIHPKMMRINVFDFYTDPRNPPTIFDYGRFEKSVNNIRSVGAEPFITLFDFPPFMYYVPDHNWAIPDLENITKWNEYKDTCRSIAAKLVSLGFTGLHYEVWNEPESFWDFGVIPETEHWKTYCTLYKYASQGILEGDPSAKIGGPATNPVCIDAFLDHFEKESSKLDFISWHWYNGDHGFLNYTKKHAEEALKRHNIPYENMEYIISEYNINSNDGALTQNDEFYNAGNLARTQLFFRADSKLTGLFFLPRGEFFGAFTSNNLPKPSYNFFKLYSKMDGSEVAVINNQSKVNAWASFDNSQSNTVYRVLLWSFASNYPTGAPINTVLILKDIPNGQYTQTNFLIDSKNSNYKHDILINKTSNIGELTNTVKTIAINGTLEIPYKMENGAVELIEFCPVH